jgi:hypothetical protein
MIKPAFLEAPTAAIGHSDQAIDFILEQSSRQFQELHKRITSRELSMDAETRLILIEHQLLNIHQLIGNAIRRRHI